MPRSARNFKSLNISPSNLAFCTKSVSYRVAFNHKRAKEQLRIIWNSLVSPYPHLPLSQVFQPIHKILCLGQKKWNPEKTGIPWEASDYNIRCLISLAPSSHTFGQLYCRFFPKILIFFKKYPKNRPQIH